MDHPVNLMSFNKYNEKTHNYLLLPNLLVYIILYSVCHDHLDQAIEVLNRSIGAEGTLLHIPDNSVSLNKNDLPQ